MYLCMQHLEVCCRCLWACMLVYVHVLVHVHVRMHVCVRGCPHACASTLFRAHVSSGAHGVGGAGVG